MNDEPPKVSSLAARRFYQTSDTTETAVCDALEAAIEWAKQEKPDHVMIIFGKNTVEDSTSKYFQAGIYGYHAQLGLCQNNVMALRESSIRSSE